MFHIKTQPWTSEEDGLLMKFHKENLTFSAIAKELLKHGFNRTRMSCLSRSRRIGLPKRDVEINNQGQNAETMVKIRQHLPDGDWYSAPDDAIGILDLKYDSCRFIYSNNKYCGHKVDEKSFCPAHKKLCYRRV